jgi:hypothetical protein
MNKCRRGLKFNSGYEYERPFRNIQGFVSCTPLGNRDARQYGSENRYGSGENYFRPSPLIFIHGYVLAGVLMVLGLILGPEGAWFFSEGQFRRSAVFTVSGVFVGFLSVAVLASTPGFLE